MKAPIVLPMSVHWLMRQVFVLLLALSVGASGTGQAFFIPTSGPDMTPTMSMNMAMDMPMDRVDTGLFGSQQGVPCKDMPLNCAGGLNCIMCVALPQVLSAVRPVERTEKQDWLPHTEGSGLSIRPALPPPIAIL
jgi:hypothetical protein